MFKNKSHFWYNKSQRNGIFLLIFIMVFLQFIYAFVNFNSSDRFLVGAEDLSDLKHKIDSLKAVEIEDSKPNIYPFNPNYLTDFKGQQLGMSIEEIDRLLLFRKKNTFINSVKEFQQITKVSDSLLSEISPFFKFPEWVLNKNQSPKNIKNVVPVKKVIISTTDLNLATAKDLQTVTGVGVVLSERIVNYRKRLQGFTYPAQLFEVWNLDSEVVKKILLQFKLLSIPNINKVNVNTATFKEVLSNPYIDYTLCKKIFDYRDEVAALQSIEDLKKIEGFPLDKYDRIVIYLEAK